MVFIINSRSNLFATPLHYAIRSESCSLDAVKYLLDHGANVHTNDYRDETPLHYLYQSHSRYSIEIAVLLLDSGVDINQVDIMGYNVLHYAVQTVFRKDIIKLLLDRGVNINALDMSDNSPLHFALKMNCSVEIIKLLIDRGADIHQFNQRDVQALHLAVSRQNVKFVKLLLERGSQLNVPDCENRSPLLISTFCNKKEISKMLLDRGALMSCGKSPLKHAINKGYLKYEDRPKNVQFLLKYALLENEVLHTEDTYCSSDLPAEFTAYREDCLREIHKMRSFAVDRRTTLAQFIFRLRERLKSRTKEDRSRICDKLLHLICTNAYPLYSEVISGLMKREYLIDKLEELMVYAASNQPNPFSDEPNSVILHTHALRLLIKYVHEADLLKLVLAFYNSRVSFTF